MSRWLSRSLKALCLILALPIIVYLGARVYWPLKGVYWRAFRTPALIHDSRVENLVVARASDQRKRLLEVWRTGRRTYGLRQTVSSIEGTPIGLTLVAENGKATLIWDYTRDEYHGSREFYVEPVRAVELVSLVPSAGNEAAGRSRVPGDTRLRCIIEGRDATWF